MSTPSVTSAAPVSDLTRVLHLPGPFALESGEALPDVQIAYRTWGRLNAARSNVVVVCHALTGSADVDDWWPGLVGPGATIDTERWFVVCSNVLGGCYGSSGPFSYRTDGKRFGLGFPQINIRDMVGAQRLLLDHLGVTYIQAVVGPSLGGMQALEWAVTDARVGGLIAVGTSAQHSAWCIGISESQRAAIAADPAWEGGLYTDDRRPQAGLAAARMMAMVSYRSWSNFDHRFGREAGDQHDYSVASYLQYQGRKLVGRFDAASYYRLTQAMDNHDLGRGRGGSTRSVLARISCPSLVVSVNSDVLYPPREQAFIADAIANSRYEILDSEHGHDGFLIDVEPLYEMIRSFLTDAQQAKQRATA
ncbi:MAG: homoserine O-acetyltransferase [Pseudomonadota bacterium]